MSNGEAFEQNSENLSDIAKAIEQRRIADEGAAYTQAIHKDGGGSVQDSRSPELNRTMAITGERIDEIGMLVREGSMFILERDAGGRYVLELQRVPIDHVAKRVRVIGVLLSDGVVSSDGVGPAS